LPMEPSCKGRSSLLESFLVALASRLAAEDRRAMASNRIGIVELLLGVVVVYVAYSLLLYATQIPHIHGDDPIEVRTSKK
jgi:hypothetical protein